jgi:hypothetical protein
MGDDRKSRRERQSQHGASNRPVGFNSTLRVVAADGENARNIKLQSVSASALWPGLRISPFFLDSRCSIGITDAGYSICPVDLPLKAGANH